MQILELRKQPHISVSSINDYTECGLLYKLSRIDKLEPSHISDSLAFGTTVHRVLADYNQQKLIGEILTANELQKRFERYWKEKEGENIRYKNGQSFDTLLKQGKRLMKTFAESASTDDYQILAIEEPFVYPVEGIEVPLIGVMDLIEEDESGTVIITDYKTSGKSYTSNQVDRNFQMTVYHMAAKANGYKHREILLRLSCLIKTKTPKFEQYYTIRSKSAEMRAYKKIQAAWNGVKQGVFVPNDNSWKCNDCAYKRHCDKWFESGG
jgi:putative RecB family exonuclease